LLFVGLLPQKLQSKLRKFKNWFVNQSNYINNQEFTDLSKGKIILNGIRNIMVNINQFVKTLFHD